MIWDNIQLSQQGKAGSDAEPSQKGHREIVKLLVASGKADLSAKNNAGRTPLSLAAERGREAVVQLLLEMGADTDVENGSGCTSLQVATLKVHRGVEQLLARYGASEPEGFCELWKLFFVK
jgi:ankyrin repeat protein